MQFILGSTNEAKKRAVEKVSERYFPNSKVLTAEVSSGVSKQPFGDEETRIGALTRALHASNLKEGSIGIGLEGGVRLIDHKLYVCNWGALALPNGIRFTAGGAQIPLPNEIAQEVLKGGELGVVLEGFLDKYNVRQKEGAMGTFTAGYINRDELFEHILQLLFGQWEYMKRNVKS